MGLFFSIYHFRRWWQHDSEPVFSFSADLQRNGKAVCSEKVYSFIVFTMIKSFLHMFQKAMSFGGYFLDLHFLSAVLTFRLMTFDRFNELLA